MSQNWRNEFFENFSEEDLQEVRVTKTAHYRFGGELPIPATDRVVIPCYILGKRTTLAADVVSSNVPLLMSKAEMKKRGFSIDFNTDSLIVDGNHYDLATTYNGHFKLHLWQHEEVNLCVTNKTFVEKNKMVEKLHR